MAVGFTDMGMDPVVEAIMARMVHPLVAHDHCGAHCLLEEN
jgi:hypothetical protein